MKIAAGSRGIHGLRGVAVPERDTGGAAAAPIIAAMLRGLLLGVPVGLLAGWLLFEWGDSDPPPTRAPVHAARPPAPPSGAATEGSAGGSVVAPEPGDAKEAGGGRVPPADVQDWIARRDVDHIHDYMQRGSDPNSQTFLRSILTAYQAGQIDEATAILASGNEVEFRRAARGISS